MNLLHQNYSWLDSHSPELRHKKTAIEKVLTIADSIDNSDLRKLSMKLINIYNKLKNLSRKLRKKRNIPNILIDRSFYAKNCEDEKLQKLFVVYCKNQGFGVRK